VGEEINFALQSIRSGKKPNTRLGLEIYTVGRLLCGVKLPSVQGKVNRISLTLAHSGGGARRDVLGTRISIPVRMIHGEFPK
jgi:hypothetical protein